MAEEVIIILGYPASGKTTFAREHFPTHTRLNRDELGGSLSKLAGMLGAKIKSGLKSFVLDNTFPDRVSRAPFIKAAREGGLPIRCYWLTTSLEDSQYNVARRMIRKYGKLLDAQEAKKTKDDNCVPSIALYAYRKAFETPTTEEGFDSVERVTFQRKYAPEYKNRALILDYDGTLRLTMSGSNYPKSPDDILIRPKRKEILGQYKDQGYILTGVSNQSGIAGGELTRDQAFSCFQKTNDLLGLDIDFNFCPHKAFPLECYCRKPSSGNGALLIERYKLNPAECIMVGDMTTDKTFATRCGFQYIPADKFFK